MSEQKTKVIYSGCEHDPEETSKGFCWQCRIAELEAEVKQLRRENERLRQRLPSTTMQTVCEIQKEQIENLKAAVRKLGGDPLEAL